MNLSEIWAKEVELYSTNQDCIKMLVGNKVDKVFLKEICRTNLPLPSRFETGLFVLTAFGESSFQAHHNMSTHMCFCLFLLSTSYLCLCRYVFWVHVQWPEFFCWYKFKSMMAYHKEFAYCFLHGSWLTLIQKLYDKRSLFEKEMLCWSDDFHSLLRIWLFLWSSRREKKS